MTPIGTELFRARLPAMLDDIATLVQCETPSDDLDAVAAGAAVVAGLGTRLLGVAPQTLTLDGRTHLRWRLGPADARPVLLLCHQDTVWPVGSLVDHPSAVVDGVLRGPGCFDMKTGVVMALHAAAALGPDRPVTVLVTGDEEIGSPSSRALIESEARGSVAALVLEASADEGALKTERKGVSLYTLTVHGRAAHAGLEPENGINAGIALAHLVLDVAQLGRAGLGTTVVPTVAAAGTTTNTVPALATLAVDVRAATVTEQLRVDEAIRALRPGVDGARITVAGGPNRPPLEIAATADLFAIAEPLAADLGGPPLTQVFVGGASDGNFTGGVGCPTLDGLGAVGGGAHADSEHVLIDRIPDRTALVAALIDQLTRA